MRRRDCLCITLFALGQFCTAQALTQDIDEIANWPAPLYWQPGPVRKAPARKAEVRRDGMLQQAAAPTLGSPATFVAMSPCRAVDTRTGGAPFGGPAFYAGEIRAIPMPESINCTIPAIAAAYSLNIAVVPGAPMMRWLTAWDTGSAQPNTATLNDRAGLITSNSAVVPAGVNGSINIFVTDPTHVIIDINGYYMASAGVSGAQGTALLKWFPAYASASFPVGISSYGVAFDGAHMWVTDFSINNVTKLRSSDGANLGKFPVGANPIDVAFDGSSIWVTNSGDGSVTKLRASDGANLGTFQIGGLPMGIAFDGACMWVADGAQNRVIKLQASNGANLGAFAVGNSPARVAFDGAHIWVSNYVDSTVTKLRASDGANLGTFGVGQAPYGLAFDGAHIWVANSGANTVSRLRASDGANLGLLVVGNNPFGVAFDGANIWVTNSGSYSVTKLRASDAASVGTFRVGSGPVGIAFDGANIWVAEGGNATKL